MYGTLFVFLVMVNADATAAWCGDRQQVTQESGYEDCGATNIPREGQWGKLLHCVCTACMAHTMKPSQGGIEETTLHLCRPQKGLHILVGGCGQAQFAIA